MESPTKISPAKPRSGALSRHRVLPVLSCLFPLLSVKLQRFLTPFPSTTLERNFRFIQTVEEKGRMILNLCRTRKCILLLRPYCRRKRVSSELWGPSLRRYRDAGPPQPGGASWPAREATGAGRPASQPVRPGTATAPAPAPAEAAHLGSGPGLVSHGSRAQPSSVSTRWSPAPCGQKAASPVALWSGAASKPAVLRAL